MCRHSQRHTCEVSLVVVRLCVSSIERGAVVGVLRTYNRDEVVSYYVDRIWIWTSNLRGRVRRWIV